MKFESLSFRVTFKVTSLQNFPFDGEVRVVTAKNISKMTAVVGLTVFERSRAFRHTRRANPDLVREGDGKKRQSRVRLPELRQTI